MNIYIRVNYVQYMLLFQKFGLGKSFLVSLYFFKIQYKLLYSKIVLQFKRTVLYLNIF